MIVAAVIVRLVMLGRQSYWIDELFSVNQSSGSFRQLLRIGSTEVHTPFYAGLLWVWTKLGSTQDVWTRLLSTLCAVIAVPITYRGLAALRFGDHLRWALTAAMAASGTSIVYSVETRSYALLLLGSVGLTMVTLRAALLLSGDSGDGVPRRIYLAWTGWVALAATAHLFGAVLTVSAVIVLAVITLVRTPGAPAAIRGRRILAWVALAALGCALQGAWLLRGLSQPGFASGTDWIQAPDGEDVWDLATTTFSSGGMTTYSDGFAWTSPIGLLAVVVLGLVAAGFGYRARRQASQHDEAREALVDSPGKARADSPGELQDGGTRDGGTREAQAAAVLLALALIVIVLVFGVSQWQHLWTLRNMVIVTPALIWGVIFLAAAVVGTAAGRRQVAVATVVLLGLSLVPTTLGLSHPYKTDFRGLLDYLITVQAERPDATFVVLGSNPPEKWKAASGRADNDPALTSVYRQIVRFRSVGSYLKAAQGGAARTGTEVVIYYPSVTHPRVEEQASSMVTRLGPSNCRRIPVYGFAVARCH